MFNWHKYPFVRLLIPFGLGIWLGLNVVIPVDNKLLFQIFTLLCALSMAIFIWLMSYSWRWLFGFIVSLSLLSGGLLTVRLQNPVNDSSHLIHQHIDSGVFVARLYEPPQYRELTVKVTLEMLMINRADSLIPVSGKLLAYFQRTETMPRLAYGDIVSFDKVPDRVEAAKNPGQFDYSNHLANKQIFHQVYLPEKNWFKTGFSETNSVFSTAYFLRDHLLKVLRENRLSGDEYAVAAAILLGYDESLPAYLRKGYVAAGAMHVLCVSGLHVGIVYLLVAFLLGFLDKAGWRRTLRTCLLLGVVWFYALLTGLSPSIQRASLMISFVLLAQLTNRKGFAVNSIAASAFFLLVLRPENLLEIGFQLSYAAVLGIVLLQRPIVSMVYIKHKYLAKVWDITAVALAAQLATTPFVLYYFHQFPLYFWLSNLFLVPLSFIIIISGMGLLLLSFLPVVPALIGKALAGLIFVMNWIIQWIESLPGSVVEGLYVNQMEFVMLLLILLLLVLLITTQRSRISFFLLFTAIFLFASFNWRRFEQQKNIQLVIFDLKKHSVIDFIVGRDHVLMADSAALDDEFVRGFHLEGHWIASGLSSSPVSFEQKTPEFKGDYVVKKGDFLCFAGKLMAVWDDDGACGDSLTYRPQVDWMLISGKKPEMLDKLLNCFDPELLILDGSVPYYFVEEWKQTASDAGISLYYTSEQGAYIYEFE